MSKNDEEIVYGKNNVIDCIKNREITKIYLSKDGKHTEVINELKIKNIPFVYTDKYVIDKMTNKGNHQGVCALISPSKYLELTDLIKNNEKKENPMIIMLDEVTDVNNLGAILRVCDAFSVNGVIFNKRRNAQLNGSVAKISTGAINHVDVCRVTNLVQTIEKLKKVGYWIAYLDMDGKTNIENVDFDLPLVVVIGGEDKGVTNNIKKHCDFGITIKMTGHVNSLNVATATAILSYQKSLSKE